MITKINVKFRTVDVADRDTLAWRLMLAREDKGISQRQLVDMINAKPYEIGLSYPGYSKIESGDTENPRIEILRALRQILNISLDELIDGELPQADIDVFATEEANRIGAMIDQLPVEDRQLIEEGTRILYQLRQVIRAQSDEISERDNQIRDLQIEVATLRKESIELNKKRLQERQQSLLHDVDSPHE